MMTDFVGREAELSHLSGLFASARLVTVVGPGGVGKTSVSLRAASSALDAYADGVWIVELSGLRDPELLPNTVASVLGVPEQDARSPQEAILDHLRDQRMLLVLDTCEHLVDACASLTEAILLGAPQVTILATSRQPLDVIGEHTFPVAPLPPGDAARLFELRARQVMPKFQLDHDSRPYVARLCQRLEGIPLAIELAAVQLRVLTLRELTQRLERHFTMLASGSRGATPDADASLGAATTAGMAAARHQTLRRAIEWSYDLCSSLERALWQRLSLFAGYFDLAAIEEVCAESDPERNEVLQALYSLVDKSVVLREPAGGERYRLLDTLREFGAERLAARGPAEEARWQARHFARYLRLAGGFRDNFATDEQIERYHALRDEHSNVRAALEYTLGATGAEDVAGEPGLLALAGHDLVNALALYWMISGRLREGGYWLGKALTVFGPPSPARAATLVTRGLLRSFQGHPAGSIADCREAIEIAAVLDLPELAAHGYLHMNLSLTFSGMHAEAEEVGLEARERLTACADRVGLLMLTCQMGHLYQLTGQLDLALATTSEGLLLLGEGTRECWLRGYLDIVSSFALFQMPGREDDCAAYATQALLAKNELGDIAGIAYALETLGWLATRAARFERCAWLLGAADPLWRRVGSRFGGTALMELVHQQAAEASQASIGADRYRLLWTLGMSLPTDHVVITAISGADEITDPGEVTAGPGA
ncbi:MAG TPA: NB-ARC domain-containing protein [Trebonia sp.]|nr:NB-ARC domain-containing protein [Trebonia sp.]